MAEIDIRRISKTKETAIYPNPLN